jgi:hypothetical protein
VAAVAWGKTGIRRVKAANKGMQDFMGGSLAMKARVVLLKINTRQETEIGHGLNAKTQRRKDAIRKLAGKIESNPG